jgi:hypothetical protein
VGRRIDIAKEGKGAGPGEQFRACFVTPPSGNTAGAAEGYRYLAEFHR